MLHLEQAIIVEGKYDKIKLSSLVDAVIVVTDGYHIFKDSEKMEIIRHYAKTTGIVIVTDSDSAGFKIRNYLKGSINDGNIINVYVPDVFGKEKRKQKPSQEGKLGVEGLEKDVILEAFKKAGVLMTEGEKKENLITRMNLYEDGFTGGACSSEKRRLLLEKLNLPERLTTTGMLEILNSMLTYDQYKAVADKISADYGGI